MFDKKVLAFVGEDSLSESTGGPGGYNYYLREGLKSIGFNSIFFIPKREKKAQPKKTSKFRKSLSNVLSVWKAFLFPKKYKSSVDFNNFDIIHFHNPIDIYRYRDSLKGFSGKILLTSHSPVFISKEIIMEMPLIHRLLLFPFFPLLRHSAIFGFKKCHYVVLPCDEAIESYKKTYHRMDKIIKNKKKYLLTGCTNQIIKKQTIESTKEKYNLPKDKFTCVYIGRHNKIKGYDLLKYASEELYNLNKNIYFVIGGSLSKIKPPKNNNWAELGYVNDAKAIIASCDLFLSGNRCTYFDLSIIEALSTGKIVLSSRTGGNKYLDKMHIPGLFLFSNKKDLVDKIIKISELSEEEIEKLSKENISIYNRYFTEKKFAENYLDILSSVSDL